MKFSDTWAAMMAAQTTNLIIYFIRSKRRNSPSEKHFYTRLTGEQFGTLTIAGLIWWVIKLSE